MTTMDWNDPAAVKRYTRRQILKDVGLPVLLGLLLVTGVMVYRRFYPLSEQERLRRRERREANLDRPVTKRDLLYVLLMLFAFVAMAMAIFQT